MSKYDEKVAKIQQDHLILLKKVKDSILENRNHLSESLDSVLTVLNIDEESTKKYKALIQAQNLILSLTQEIAEADDIEKIIELRKKVNYYINKIKNELKKRESNEELLLEYQTKVSYLRKDIAKYIRFLKRERIINEIERTNTQYDELSEEDKKQFQKLVRNEVRYNSRNHDSFNLEPAVSVVDNHETKNNIDENEEDNQKLETISFEKEEEFQFVFSDRDKSKDSLDQITRELEDLFTFSPFESENEMDSSIDSVDAEFYSAINVQASGNTSSSKKFIEICDSPFTDVDPYLRKKILVYMKQYNIVDTIDYGTSPIKNFVSLLKNIPRYIHNRRRMKLIRSDFTMFYRGSDLISFYEYTKRRNSFQYGLKSIFKKTHLFGDEDKYLSQHEKCSKWIYDFCINNSMNMLIPLELSK